MEEFINWLVYHLADYWLAHGGLSQFSAAQGPLTAIPLRHAVMQFTQPTELPFSTRDTMQVGCTWAKTDGGTFDGGWDDGDLDNLTAFLEGWWTLQKTNHATVINFDSIRYYAQGTGTPDPNPVIRVDPVGVAGTSTGAMLPRQDSSTITLQTGSRKHWGRMYLPPLCDTNLGTTTASGRYAHGTVDANVTNWTSGLADLLLDHNIIQCVWSPVSNSALGITAFSSDDIPDIQRRRRSASIGYRKVVDA